MQCSTEHGLRVALQVIRSGGGESSRLTGRVSRVSGISLRPVDSTARRFRPSVSHQRLGDGEHAAGVVAPGVMREDLLAGGGTYFATPSFVGRQCRISARLGRIAGAVQPSGAAMLDDVTCLSDLRRHDGAGHGHVLEQLQRRKIAVRIRRTWRHAQSMAWSISGTPACVALRPCARSRRGPNGQLAPERRQFGSGAHQQQPEGAFGPPSVHGLEQRRNSVPSLHAAGKPDHEPIVPTQPLPKEGWPGAGRTIWIGAIGNHGHAVALSTPWPSRTPVNAETTITWSALEVRRSAARAAIGSLRPRAFCCSRTSGAFTSRMSGTPKYRASSTPAVLRRQERS